MLIVEAEQAYDWGSNNLGEYLRLFGNAMFSWALTRDDMVKLRFAGGYSEDKLPFQKAFRLGGINTLRGYDFESVALTGTAAGAGGANRMALCNMDYFFGRDNDLSFVLFADAGNVWAKGDDVDYKDLKRDIGIGLTFGDDFFWFGDDVSVFGKKKGHQDGLRINWAVPVGNVPHVSHWTVNFVRAY